MSTRVPIIDKNGKFTHVWKNISRKTNNRVVNVDNSGLLHDKNALIQNRLEPKICKSRKHNVVGCGLSECPEGLSIPRIMREIVSRNKAYDWSDIDRLHDIDLETVRLHSAGEPGGWINATVSSRDGRETGLVRLPKDRTYLLEQAKKINKTIVPSFATLEEMTAFIKEIYNGVIYIKLSDRSADEERKFCAINDIYIDAQMRGIGIGSHVMSIITKHADENHYVLSLVPSEAGDGSIRESSIHYEENRKSHYSRLRKFYTEYGFEDNMFYYGNGKDVLGNYFFRQENLGFIEKASKESVYAIGNSTMVRFPERQIPEWLYEETQPL